MIISQLSVVAILDYRLTIKMRNVVSRWEETSAMKGLCNDCKFEFSGEARKELDDAYRSHEITFGHSGYCVVNYD